MIHKMLVAQQLNQLVPSYMYTWDAMLEERLMVTTINPINSVPEVGGPLHPT